MADVVASPVNVSVTVGTGPGLGFEQKVIFPDMFTIGVAVGVGVDVGVGAWKQTENSEVLFCGSVAVAVKMG